MSTIAVRPVRPAELESVGHLVADAFVVDGHTERGGHYESVIRDTADRAARAVLLVAVDEETGELLGSVTFAPPGSPYCDLAVDDEGEFRMLAVSPDARGRGVGALLVRAVLDRGRELGLSRIVMSTQKAMVFAHRIYDREGFVRTPERDWSPIPGIELMTYARELTD